MRRTAPGRSRTAIARPDVLDWVEVAKLDTLAEVQRFVIWVGRLGSGERHLGEASVLAAAELLEGVAITDDRNARRVGQFHGVEVHGTVWLLARACRDGKLTLTAVESLVDALRATGLRLPCTGGEFEGYARQHGLL